MRTHVLVAIIPAVVLASAALFVWRVLFYYQKIQSGELAAFDLSFADRLTESQIAQAVSSFPASDVDVNSGDDPSTGPADAKLTIVEFVDYGCPYSKEASYGIRRLGQSYEQNVRVVYRDFPIAEVHPDAPLASEAAGCANEQGKFLAYHDTLYQNQNNLSRDALIRYATQVGIDMEEFQECLSSGFYTQEVEQDIADGLAASVYGTPTFFFNGQRVEGAIPENVLEAIIEASIAN